VYNFVTLNFSGVFLSDLTLILLAAGSSSRFNQDVKKQWLRIGTKPLWQFVAQKLQKEHLFKELIVVAAPEEISFMQNYANFTFVTGGDTRQASLQNALASVKTPFVLVSDVARACISRHLLDALLAKKNSADVVVPYLPVSDTIVYENKTIDREKVKRIQTPQLSKTAALKAALQTDEVFTDESSAIVANGGSRAFVFGDEDAHKITYVHDLQKLPCLQAPSTEILSGNGFDVHAFEANKTMWLGGVRVDVDYGFAAHSDGDVAIHALIDALLGAAGMGDIGMLFPDTDQNYEGIDSKVLLADVVQKLHNFGFEIINVDITIAAQKPRLSAYKQTMRQKLAEVLKLELQRVNVKATTTEKLGFVGRSEGVAVMANANLKYLDWKNEE
jgi:2-C-methyl-D-erythritol 4-phosphate cytidylyltransferase/2-C-methyl-D-erythritol 2,4-cyclodiphosphate synthase